MTESTLAPQPPEPFSDIELQTLAGFLGGYGSVMSMPSERWMSSASRVWCWRY